LRVEELEEVIAPGLRLQHNEMLVSDEVELNVEELEDVIAPGLRPQHNETLVAGGEEVKLMNFSMPLRQISKPMAIFSGDDKSQMTYGKWDDEAEVLYRRALAITENNLGPDHSDVATIYHNLAGITSAGWNTLVADTLRESRSRGDRLKSERALRPELWML
jgi:hypothetical protein